MNPTPSAVAAADTAAQAAAAREIGFGECAQAVQRVLMSTPVGWLLVAWFSWSRAPHDHVLWWLGGFCCSWIAALWLLHDVVAAAPSLARHGRRLLAIAVLDGLGWGAAAWLLIGFDPTLDAWIVAILCGVAAVNAPIYITWFLAYATLMGTLWLAVVASVLARGDYTGGRELAIGMTIFCGLLTHHMRTIARRVMDGIVLQLSNASLAAQLGQALQLVRQEAETDVLTGQPNRRALDDLLRQQLSLARSHRRVFSVLLLDIDHFKRINDTHGHAAGDEALRAFARRVREHLRQGDSCARYGGEEFVVVLPGTDLAAALEVAERLRLGVAELPLLDPPPVRASVSIGAAQYVAGETAEQLLVRADTAVYVAKRNGRNQVRTAGEIVPV